MFVPLKMSVESNAYCLVHPDLGFPSVIILGHGWSRHIHALVKLKQLPILRRTCHDLSYMLRRIQAFVSPSLSGACLYSFDAMMDVWVNSLRETRSKVR